MKRKNYEGEMRAWPRWLLQPTSRHPRQVYPAAPSGVLTPVVSLETYSAKGVLMSVFRATRRVTLRQFVIIALSFRNNKCNAGDGSSPSCGAVLAPPTHRAAKPFEIASTSNVLVHGISLRFGGYRHRVQFVRPNLEENFFWAFRRRGRFNHRLMQLSWHRFKGNKGVSAARYKGTRKT